MAPVGTIGAAARADVDERGRVTTADLELDWWVGADDGWHIAAESTTVRQQRPHAAPQYETAVRVPGGEMVHRVFAVATPSGGGAVVVDIENASRAPCSLAVIVRARAKGTVTLVGSTLAIDGRPVLTLSRRPRLWAAGTEMRDIVTSGRASGDDAAPSWRAPTDIALLVPAPHRTIFRAGLASEPLDLSALPDAEAASRGWSALLDRGLRTELPEPWQTGVDAARADLLLEPPSAEAFVALEDWGFDNEAAAMWGHLSGRERRRAHKRATARDTTLATTRDRLAREDENGVELLPDFPAAWLGQPVAVHDLPLRTGGLSYAVRWHGARPALLWDAPAGVPLRVPTLDPDWAAPGGAGETLLAEPPAPLLAMGTTQRDGESIADPGSFA
jgi:hypothetical protein